MIFAGPSKTKESLQYKKLGKRLIMLYTDEQKKMIQNGYTLCMECKRGYLGDKSCGANGEMNLPQDMPSGCTGGEKIDDTELKAIVSNSDDIERVLNNYGRDNKHLIETKISFSILSTIDLSEYKNIYRDCQDAKKRSVEFERFCKHKIQNLYKQITSFASDIKDNTQVIGSCEITSKSFSIKEKLAENICELLKKFS